MKILSIKKLNNKENVYDLVVEKNHNFIANGVVVHNCGAQELCSKSKPKSVKDIANITALYRPGPLASKADVKYLERINDPSLWKNEHSAIKAILGETYDLVLYQEQIMHLANKIAGFTLTEADDLRKLLMKPIISLGDEMKKKRTEAGERFINGCVEIGVSEKRAHELWHDEIIPFISYAFNKSLHFTEKVSTYTEQGNFLSDIEIQNIEPGMIVKTRNEDKKIDEFTKVKAKHDHGIIEVFEVELENGEKVKCTMNHKFRVKDGRMLPLWKILKNNLEIVSATDAIKR